ncbi:serine hydrolase domain-containing protein [Jatrophihabitans sp. YIM 134969]
MLPVSTPAAEGVDAGGVLALVDALEQRQGVEPHGLTVVRHGRIVASGHWAPYRSGAPRLLYSLSKSFTSTAVGFAVAEGLLSVDDLVLDHFPEYAEDAADDRVRSWRIRHLLAMSSGHTADTWPDVVAAGGDPVQAFLRLAPPADPGSVFSYNQSCTYTVGAIVQKLTGLSLPEFLQPRLFDVVGGGPVTWLDQPGGRSLGFSGLHASHDDVVRLGHLYLQRGRWGDRQVLPTTWVDAATSRQVGTPGEPNPDWQQGYGYQFWQGRHGYRGDGAYGQFCIVLPRHDAVVVITSATLAMQSVLDDVYTHLLPALGDEPLQDAADGQLATRLESLQLPTPVGDPAPPDAALWDGATFAPRGGVSRVQQSLTAVRVTRSRVDGSWQLTLVEGDTSFTVTLRPTWTADHVTATSGDVVPVAAAGAFTPRGELRADLRFLDTPHTLTLILDPATRAFRALWPTIPLHSPPLHRLHAPTS